MTNAILGEVQIKLSLLQKNTTMHKNLGFHRWSHLTKIILGAPFMERHRVSLCFSPRPRLSAILTDESSSGHKLRVRLKIKSDKVNLHLCEPIEPEDKTATFLLSNLVISDNFSLKLSSNSKIKLPSQVVFRDYLQKDNGNALKLQQKITLPIRTSHQYTDLTVAAEVFPHNMLSQHQLQVDNNVEKTGIKLHSDRSSHSHSSQYSHNICGADNYSEINTFENIKFASNFGSLPVREQMKLLENGGHSVTNENNISHFCAQFDSEFTRRFCT